MVNPATALLVFAFIVMISVIILMPRWGVFAVIKRIKRNNNKILIEDALKLLYDRSLKNETCTNDLLGEYLGINSKRAGELSSILEEMNLASLNGDLIILTEEGKGYAVKVVRIHRLLEKFFAEETSIDEVQWHNFAEEKEHLISDNEMAELSSRLGNPLTDPHGDPIPNESGEFFQPDSFSLLEMHENDTGRIAHIEDEPTEIYSKILLIGLHAGSVIKILGLGKNKIFIEADGREIILPKELAGNISITPIKPELVMENFKRLSELQDGEEAFIIGISKAMRGQQRRRLLDFGFVPGTKINRKLASLGGDPAAYEIRGTTVALRKLQSELVFVKKAEEGIISDGN